MPTGGDQDMIKTQEVHLDSTYHQDIASAISCHYLTDSVSGKTTTKKGTLPQILLPVLLFSEEEIVKHSTIPFPRSTTLA